LPELQRAGAPAGHELPRGFIVLRAEFLDKVEVAQAVMSKETIRMHEGSYG
jgi:hypothetical protein